MDELIALCKSAELQATLGRQEALLVNGWIEENRKLAGEWPVNILCRRFKSSLKAGGTDPDEHSDLIALLRCLSGLGPTAREAIQTLHARLPLDEPPPAVTFPGKSFCFIGRFVSGARAHCEAEAARRGGQIRPYPSSNLDYLVIGILESADWTASAHARKIEATVAFKEGGMPVAIISEEHWVRATESIRP